MEFLAVWRKPPGVLLDIQRVTGQLALFRYLNLAAFGFIRRGPHLAATMTTNLAHILLVSQLGSPSDLLGRERVCGRCSRPSKSRVNRTESSRASSVTVSRHR